MPNQRSILLTGGTGYVGGRLIPLLEKQGYPLRCVARQPQHLEARVQASTEIVQGDLFEPESLRTALDGIDTAFYMVHSLGTGQDFEKEDRTAALNFAEAARHANVRRIIYLGGLGESQDGLSPHLRSRQEVGDILRQAGSQVIEFRASIIIGSGSLSFELIRSLVQKLPVMIWPQWVSTPAQPIAIEDVLAYLMAAIEYIDQESRVFEIGGPDQVSYGGVMLEYANQRGLKRWTIPVPFLSPRLSSLWLGLVTPVFARIGRKLVESLRNPTVVHNDDALQAFPDIQPRSSQAAIARALAKEDQEFAETRWSDAISSAGSPKSWGGVRFGNRLVDSRTATTHVSAERAFEPIRKIGGKTGWYFATWLWRIRGYLDLMVGGVGMRRGRRNPNTLTVGETLDFWRVQAYEPNRRLRLDAEMKLPGRAWLEFEVTESAGATTIRQTAVFDPVGLLGLMYWYGIYPLHRLIFAGMLREIVKAAERTNSPNTFPEKLTTASIGEDVTHANTSS
ncbi:3 beta-hydroxysteroid dehydrogenase/Delta 5--_4-isomerase [Symmachiella dynata]|uniref:3 beta-hydroxysteroid dehydrogenase/Delta 5-->4-isomerase n=1 Tax=Symmachiella dynata TaxID=2527995 RepID=A0A517ZQH4_9PLAN|nr:SDR family oxidoreductase [Symmachiella dynata]QDU44744.1 3 beta-hydroxysteroid dehydrogenase/Delta 5-->4-isomerase [Symmachiella dynata]